MINLPTLSTVNDFSCDRTCPAHRTHWCRFNAFFRLLGAQARVHSHTVKVKVDYNYQNPKALERACENLKWPWLGLGVHNLCSSSAAGYAFKPEGWLLPAILDSDGELHTDCFGGQWGDINKLELLKAEYLYATAEQAANELGWQCERTDTGLVVHHPDGGQLTVSNEGVCETTGFVGTGCHAAREALGLLADGAIQNKPEYGAVAQEIQAGN